VTSEFELLGIPFPFFLFAATLAAVAISHKHALVAALGGLASIVAYHLVFGDLDLVAHFGHEAVLLLNLFGLLTGFAVVADHFERSHAPMLVPRWLPSGRLGAFSLLAVVWVLSGFLDNIAAAIIGVTIANDLFQRKVHIGYLAAIVAAANAGGAGSVIGDTTTTMMWIAGISPGRVVEAYLGAFVVLVVSGFFGAMQQHQHSPMPADPRPGVHVDRTRIALVVGALLVLISTNVTVSASWPELSDRIPVLALALWGAIAVGTLWRAPDWKVAAKAAYGSCFLLALVLCASLMPVQALPAPSAVSTLGIGFVSAIFDNIPLTKLALEQGGYDWGSLAFAVGVGGSMIWFGSSAGVAVATTTEEARSVGKWLRHGWHVPLGFALGYLVMQGVVGWHP
jgi:Na+/H+ antiporter NhaD/arsenite permease-like protein